MTSQAGIDKPFPERCLRGLRVKDHIERDLEGAVLYISELAFKPPTKKENLEDRISNRHKSNHYESSINWEDQLVEPFRLLAEDKKNAGQGIIIIRLADLLTAKQVNPLATQHFDWERAEVKGNLFHGNLLFSGELPTPVVRMLAAVIATHVQPNLVFIEPENYDTEFAARTIQATASEETESEDYLVEPSSSITQIHATEPEPKGFLKRFLFRLQALFRQ